MHALRGAQRRGDGPTNPLTATDPDERAGVIRALPRRCDEQAPVGNLAVTETVAAQRAVAAT